jgi:twitching motility protein PilT
MAVMTELLNYMLQMRASDVHLKAGSSPALRIDGRLQLSDMTALNAPKMEELAKEIVPAGRAKEFLETGELDFAIGYPGMGRFRVSVMRQRGSVAIALRRVPTSAPSFDTLGFPAPVRQIADLNRGLILVTGPADSGKSTTAASIIDTINQTHARSIITIEDPIELLHADKQSFVTQREVGTDTKSHFSGFTKSLRHDPDVVFLDRIPDQETMEAVLTAASGRLIISTMTSLNATDTVSRVVDFFPPHLARQARFSLGSVLEAVISQRLLEREDKPGRVPVFELMITTPRIHDSITQQEGSQELETLIETGDYNGMQTIDQHLTELYHQGVISLREALSAATHPRELRVALQHVN